MISHKKIKISLWVTAADTFLFKKKKAMEKCTILKFLLTRFNMVHVYFYDAEAAFEFMAN